MSRLTEAQQAAALDAIGAITYFGEDECIALLEALQQKVQGSYARGEWSTQADSVIGDLLADMKYVQREAQRYEERMQKEELPDMPATLGQSDLSRAWFPGMLEQFNALVIRGAA